MLANKQMPKQSNVRLSSKPLLFEVMILLLASTQVYQLACVFMFLTPSADQAQSIALTIEDKVFLALV